MRIRDLTLHVGVPKTGSSLLQRMLRNKRVGAALARRGWAYLSRQHMLELDHLRAWAAYGRGTKRQRAAFIDELADKAAMRIKDAGRPRKRHLIVSNESMLGRVGGEYGDPFWPRAEGALTDVLAALRPKRTRVLIYVRRQDRFLESFFMQRIHRGRSLKFRWFMNHAGAGTRVRYQDVLDVIERLPTVESVRVRPFEIIGGGSLAFFRDFLEPLGLGEVADGLADPGLSNPSYTQPAYEAAQVINPLLDTDDQRGKTRRFLKKLFPPSDYPRVQLLTPEDRVELLRRYAPENEAFFRRYLPEFPADSYSHPDNIRSISDFLKTGFEHG
jgi:hypothetical protein